jgi:uncharacterized membrane protein
LNVQIAGVRQFVESKNDAPKEKKWFVWEAVKTLLHILQIFGLAVLLALIFIYHAQMFALLYYLEFTLPKTPEIAETPDWTT